MNRKKWHLYWRGCNSPTPFFQDELRESDLSDEELAIVLLLPLGGKYVGPVDADTWERMS